MKNLNVRFVIAICLLAFGASVGQAQQYKIVRDTVVTTTEKLEEVKTQRDDDIKFYFKINSFDFDINYGQNRQEVSRIDAVMGRNNALLGLDSLFLNAAASIDGNEKSNGILAQRRAQSVRKFLVDRYPILKEELIRISSVSEDWDNFRAMVVADDNVPHKEELLKIIDDNSRQPDTKEWLIKSMRNRVVWNYLRVHILPKQRYGASMVFYYDIEVVRTIMQKEMVVLDSTLVLDPLPLKVVAAELPVRTIADRVAPPEPEPKRLPIALKTNLLYDVVGAVNLELEVPIGQRWSVSAEGIFPWWRIVDSNLTEKIRGGHLGLTYWLGDRENKEQLTGWNIGLFGGYSDFDLQPFSQSGVQGNIINTGISIGYAHSIAKNLHLHYQIGFGYAQYDYKEYTMMWDTKYGDVKVFDRPWVTKTKSWIGPTQAEVSLVWMINLGKNNRK